MIVMWDTTEGYEGGRHERREAYYLSSFLEAVSYYEDRINAWELIITS